MPSSRKSPKKRSSLAQVHPEIRRVLPLIFRDLRDEEGIDARVVSSFRSLAEQRKLHDAYVRGRGGRAAPPGSSAHNFGLAVDVNLARAGKALDAFSREGRRAYAALHDVAARYGLANIMKDAPDDPFHLQAPNWRRYTDWKRKGRSR